MNQIIVSLQNNEVLKTLTKTLTLADAAAGSTIALCERCSGKLIMNMETLFHIQGVETYLFQFFYYRMIYLLPVKWDYDWYLVYYLLTLKVVH